MELYLDVAMSETEEKDKCKALLYVIGQDGRDIYNTFIIQEGNKDKIAPLFTQLNDTASRKKMQLWNATNCPAYEIK